MMAAVRILLLVLGSVGHSAGSCPNITVTARELCAFCQEDSPFRYKLSCNVVTAEGHSIADITELVRSETAEENFTQLLFSGFEADRVLTKDTFAGFTSLDTLHILNSGLQYIEAGTFSLLPNLKYLLLYENSQLRWLSGDSFSGISSLDTLDLHRNSIEHLREDMEPLFSAVQREIDLENLPLHCDCHLNWLVNFISSHSNITISTTDTSCISDPNTDFSQCLDVCQLGYHPCHSDASCTVVIDTESVCTCNSCYEGTGIECRQRVCPSENMECVVSSGECECREDFSPSTDGDSCIREVSEVFSNLSRDCSGLKPADTETLSECAEMLSHATTHHLTLPAEISRVVSLLQSLVGILTDEEAQPPSFNISKNLVETASELLNEGNLQLWQDTTSDSTRDVVAIFSAMNDLGTLLLTHTNITNITTDNIAMVLVRPDCESKQSVPGFDGYNISSDLLGKPPPTSSASTLSLPSSLFSDVFADVGVVDCFEVGVVSLVYGGIGPPLSLNEDQLLEIIGCSNSTSDSQGVCPWYGDAPVICPTDWQLNSVIISATVINSSAAISTQLSSPVTISLSHSDPSLSNPVCAFIDESQSLQSSDSWLTENCERDAVASTDTTTVCNCYHLTSFALVMSPSNSPPENQPLNIATKAGLSLSILCLLATVVLLFGLKLKTKTLHQVHRQLALALGLAQLVFLVGVDRTAVPSPDQLCTAWAALLHYFLLATFLWQLCEGVHLFLLIGKVFGKFEKLQPIYCLVAWGLPLLIVGPTLGVRFCDYGSTNYCWISPDGGALWAFHGPVIAVLLTNVVILVYVVVVIVRLTKRKEENACLFITLIHASVVLVPILGVTWALGFLVVGGGVYATVVEWLFFAFTTLQGSAIFFAHCILNREVRSSFLKSIGCRRMASNQDTVINIGRKMSRAGVNHSYMLRRNSSQASGSMTVGGFVAPTATPSRRESETENPYHHFSLNTIREESSCHDNVDEEHGKPPPISEENSCHDDDEILT